ncbi:hypothetical protein SP15_139 [Bacillus phage SP-15]|uniref:Uncharacterized protein n=1 Tax=Bacillus phage SP-15 TaxID=1792032 RepID=A0A127AWH7_9CAUD|nr:hypothetical protein SP15_139 [Bacillus phage SP-15]AMM44937.1 hypothetical protein SP15_139 [Bacillus phage SP-15]
MAGVYELEAKVKAIYNKDPDNPDPDLYLAIRNLAEKILVVKHIAGNREEVESISHNLAADLYMSIASGKLRVSSWTKYVWLRLYKYRELYLKEKGKQFFKAKDWAQVDTLKNLHSGSKHYFNSMADIEYEDLIDRIPQVFKEKYEEFSRYTPQHCDYENILLSVVLTIVRGDLTLYNVPSHSSGYVRMMSRVIIQECYKYIKKYSGGDNTKVHEFTSYFEVVYND